MHRGVERMLNDGEPNLPFMFSWANEPWVRTWTGIEDSNTDSVLIEQKYCKKVYND